MKQRYPKHAKRDTDKFKLNKIAARWLAKAVAQLSFSQ
jgi:hypothetical protein